MHTESQVGKNDVWWIKWFIHLSFCQNAKLLHRNCTSLRPCESACFSLGSLNWVFANRGEKWLWAYFVFYFSFIIFLKILFLFLGEGMGEEGGDTSMCGCLSHIPHWGPGPQPRHVPWLGINQWPFGLPAGTQSTEPHQPGDFYFLESAPTPGYHW